MPIGPTANSLVCTRVHPFPVTETGAARDLAAHAWDTHSCLGTSLRIQRVFMYKRDPVLPRVHVYLRIVRATRRRSNPLLPPLCSRRARLPRNIVIRGGGRKGLNMTRVFYSVIEICILDDWNFCSRNVRRRLKEIMVGGIREWGESIAREYFLWREDVCSWNFRRKMGKGWWRCRGERERDCIIFFWGGGV